MKNNTPRRKRLNQPARLARAKDWINSYTGKNLVRGYSNWFGVDLLCALRELKLSGATFDPETENRITKAFEQRVENKRKVKQARDLKAFENFDADENFAVIIQAEALMWNEMVFIKDKFEIVWRMFQPKIF